jgi:hypothetical protein
MQPLPLHSDVLERFQVAGSERLEGRSPVPLIATMFVGFGPSAQAAARLLLLGGQSASTIYVLAAPEERSQAEACALKARSLDGAYLPSLPGVRHVLVDLGDSERTLAIVTR